MLHLEGDDALHCKEVFLCSMSGFGPNLKLGYILYDDFLGMMHDSVAKELRNIQLSVNITLVSKFISFSLFFVKLYN